MTYLRQGVDAACMAVPWLVCVGFGKYRELSLLFFVHFYVQELTLFASWMEQLYAFLTVLMYSALFAKLVRIKEIMDGAQNFRRVQVPRSRVLGTVGVLLSLQVVILVTWQLYDPLVWSREVTERDSETNYPTQSIGQCTCENVGAFAAACACFIGACLAYALKLAYQTRNLPFEFSESKYIGISIVYLLQLLVLGSPLLFIAQGQNNSTFYIVASLVLFLSSFGTTLLIFVPKLIVRKNQDGRRTERAVWNTVVANRESESAPGSTVADIRARIARGSTDIRRSTDIEKENNDENGL